MYERKFIDQKEILKDIEERICKNCGVRSEPLACQVCKAGRVISRVEKAPTTEAKPVVHAHWNDDGRCTNCGEHAPFYAMASTYHKSTYCHGCGAQMDKVIVEENATTTNNKQKKRVDNHIAEDGKKGVKIPVISMDDVPKIAKEMENNA